MAKVLLNNIDTTIMNNSNKSINFNNNNLSRTINSLSVIVGSPRSRVDVNVVAVEAKGLGLQGIKDVSVKDSDPTNFGVVGNADGAKGVVGNRGDSSLKLRLEKLIPGVNFINVLQAPFLYKSLFGSYSLLTCKKKTAVQTLSYEK